MSKGRWVNSETNEADCETCWVHPGWADYEKKVAEGRITLPFTTTITFAPGGTPLKPFKPKRLNGLADYENPRLRKFYNDWCAGRITIPGLRVTIKTAAGDVMGPAKLVKGRIVPLKKVKIA